MNNEGICNNHRATLFAVAVMHDVHHLKLNVGSNSFQRNVQMQLSD